MAPEIAGAATKFPPKDGVPEDEPVELLAMAWKGMERREPVPSLVATLNAESYYG